MGLRQENEDLLKRIGEVQQQMWTLDEKVCYFDQSSQSKTSEDIYLSAYLPEIGKKTDNNHYS
jgi:hypothetical protein